jgi:integrase
MRLKIKWIEGWAYAHGTAPDGKRIRRALGTTDHRKAEEARAHLESRLWRSSLYGPADVMTFEECALAYAKNGGDVRFLVKITEQLATVRLKDVTPAMIRSAALKAYPAAKPATVNRQAITPARAVVNFGHKQGWCPAMRVDGFKVKKPIRRAVDRAYLDAMRPHLPPPLFALMLFLHQTGRRVSEALALTPADLDGRRVHIAETKNGDPATAYLSDEMAALIADLQPRHGLLFGYVKRSSLYPTLRRAAKKAGVEYLGTHQPGRHSFATTLADAGWSTKAIADAGGWKSTRIVADTYEHPADSAERASQTFGKRMTQVDNDNGK